MNLKDKIALRELRDRSTGADKTLLRRTVNYLEYMESQGRKELAKTLYLMNGSAVMAEGIFYGQPEAVMYVQTDKGNFEVTSVEHYTGYVYTSHSYRRVD